MRRNEPKESDGSPFEADLADRVVGWYRDTRRDLPWRSAPSAYHVWLSEVMLQQTRVETVVPYYHRFLDRFPTLEALAEADEDSVLALWSGLGYYRRARALLAGARVIARDHDAVFPDDKDAALAIPGVGPYTAAAVLSIAYGQPLPVLDGNVERVVTRVRRIGSNPRQAAVKRRLHEILASWLPPADAGDFNQAMMELGATICTPTSPDCARCPIAVRCAARERNDATSYPRLPKRRPTVAVDLAVGILRQDGRYLLERHRDATFLEGLWLFPTREVSTPPDSGDSGPPLAASLSRRLGAAVVESRELAPVQHAITYRRITLHPRILTAPRISLRGRRGLRWARLEDFGNTVAVSSICLKLAARLDD